MTKKMPENIKRALAQMADAREFHFKRWAEKGSNMTPGQVVFLKDVAARDWTWYTNFDIHDYVQLKSAMDPNQRNRKMEVLNRMRNGLADLAMLRYVAAPDVVRFDLKPWLTKNDMKKVFDVNDLCEIVEFAVGLFGREYADAILERLNVFYGREGEEIVVQRPLRGPLFGVR